MRRMESLISVRGGTFLYQFQGEGNGNAKSVKWGDRGRTQWILPTSRSTSFAPLTGYLHDGPPLAPSPRVMSPHQFTQ